MKAQLKIHYLTERDRSSFNYVRYKSLIQQGTCAFQSYAHFFLPSAYSALV